jgi:hypothetical protein
MVIALQQLVPQVELKEMKGDLSFGESGEEISDVRGWNFRSTICNFVTMSIVALSVL